MIGTASSFLAKLGCLPLVPDVMTTSMTLFCQLLALGRAPNKVRDRSIRSQLNSRCQLVSLPSLFIAIYIAKTKALLPTILASAKCLLQYSQFDNTKSRCFVYASAMSNRNFT